MRDEKPIPEWAMKAAGIDTFGYESVKYEIARLVAKTRADAMRDATRTARDGLANGDFEPEDIMALLDKEPS